MKIFFPIIIASLACVLMGSSQVLKAQNAPEIISTELILQLEEGNKPSASKGQYELISPTFNVYRIRFSRISEAKKFFEETLLKEHTQVIHYNRRIQFRDTLPNDPDFGLQYAFQNTLNAGFDVQASDAWDISRGGISARGDTVVIAVIDDGVEIEHEDLKENIFVFKNEIAGTGLDNDGNGYVDDVNGYNVLSGSGELLAERHGTGVAGIIGARGDNERLITGANWQTKILPVTMGQDATVAEVIKAYEYILDQRRLYNASEGAQGAYIVAANNSFGLEGFTYESAPYWCDFFDTLGQEGIITVAAAPNRIFDIDEIGDLPTVCPSPYLITVASTNFRQEWVSSGISTEHVDVTSYGGNVLTLGLNNSTSFSQNSTSSAAAMVSGLIGLMYSVPCADFVDEVHEDLSLVYLPVRNALFGGLESKSFLENKTSTGGITNFYETLRILAESCDTCLAPQEVNFSFINPDEDSVLITPTLLSDSLIWLRRSSGMRNWDTLEVAAIDTFFLEMGPGCMDEQFAFIPICDSIAGTRSQIFDVNELKDCQACEIEYCRPSSSPSKEVWIESISFKNDEVYSSNDLGYGKYTQEVFTTYETAEKQFIDILFNKKNLEDTLSFAVWLDIDHSGTFDPLERVGTLVTSSPQSDEILLDIPFTAEGGLTTLRLGMLSGSNEVNRLQPCDAVPLEAHYEDHCVNIIVNDPMCDLIDSVDVIERGPSSLTIKYFPELSDDDEGINVRYRVEGEEDWTRMTHKGKTFLMEDLEGPCTTYELEIRRVCEFDTSDYTSFLVETFCPTSTPEENIQVWQVYPNPFSQVLFIQRKSDETSSCHLQLFDQKGALVHEMKEFIISGSSRVRIPAHLPEGMYYLQIIHKGGVFQRKIIKTAP